MDIFAPAVQRILKHNMVSERCCNCNLIMLKCAFSYILKELESILFLCFYTFIEGLLRLHEASNGLEKLIQRARFRLLRLISTFFIHARTRT